MLKIRCSTAHFKIEFSLKHVELWLCHITYKKKKLSNLYFFTISVKTFSLKKGVSLLSLQFLALVSGFSHSGFPFSVKIVSWAGPLHHLFSYHTTWWVAGWLSSASLKIKQKIALIFMNECALYYSLGIESKKKAFWAKHFFF